MLDNKKTGTFIFEDAGRLCWLLIISILEVEIELLDRGISIKLLLLMCFSLFCTTSNNTAAKIVVCLSIVSAGSTVFSISEPELSKKTLR